MRGNLEFIVSLKEIIISCHIRGNNFSSNISTYDFEYMRPRMKKIGVVRLSAKLANAITESAHNWRFKKEVYIFASPNNNGD